MRSIIFFSLALSLVYATAQAQDSPDIEALKKGMPKDVATFISRAFGCNHWGGEEAYDAAYDAARAKEIKEAVRKLGCDKLEADETTLRKKYKDDPKVLRAMKKAMEP